MSSSKAEEQMKYKLELDFCPLYLLAQPFWQKLPSQIGPFL